MENTELYIGAHIVYGMNGVCRIDSIEKMKFSGDKVGKMYYILKPVNNQASKLFVPVDSESVKAKFRKVMTKEEIDSLLYHSKDLVIIWNSDRRQRTEEFNHILASGIREDLLLMIRCIYEKKIELAEQNKKLSMTDENTLKTAEKLVNEEFAYSLGILPSEVEDYIKKALA